MCNLLVVVGIIVFGVTFLFAAVESLVGERN